MSRKAGVYLRISEDRTGEGLAVDRQRQECSDLIARRGWEQIGEYVDNDISAAGRRTRPSFDQLLTDVEHGKVDTIIALSLDRLTRNRRDQLRLIETCQHHRVLVALVKGSDVDMTTAVGRAMADMMAVWARMEIEQKSERHRAQIAQAAKAGKPGGGPRAFGYRKGGMEIDPVEGPIVVELYRKFLTGSGLGELCDWLNLRKQVTTPRGARWGASSVRVVLANPRNAGLRGVRWVVDEKTGRRSQWHTVVGPALWPGLVEEPTWRAAVEILADPTRGGRNHTSGGNRPQHLLSTVALCGRNNCGRHMIASSGAGGRRTYRCSGKMHLVRAAEPLEDFVQVALLTRLRRPDAVHLLEGAPDGSRLEALRDEALHLEARSKGLAADYADGVLDREQMRTAGARLRARRADVEREIASYGEVDVVAPLVLASSDEAAWELWGDYPVSTQRQVIAQLMEVVVLRGRPGRPPKGAAFDPSSVRLTWRGPNVNP